MKQLNQALDKANEEERPILLRAIQDYDAIGVVRWGLTLIMIVAIAIIALAIRG